MVSHGHWMTLKIDLKDWMIYIYDYDLYLRLHLLQSWRSGMEERKKDHAPQSDSLIPYAEGRILPTGWHSTSDGHLQSSLGTYRRVCKIDWWRQLWCVLSIVLGQYHPWIVDFWLYHSSNRRQTSKGLFFWDLFEQHQSIRVVEVWYLYFFLFSCVVIFLMLIIFFLNDLFIIGMPIIKGYIQFLET